MLYGCLVTVFILEQVPTGSVSEASKCRVLEALFRRWFRNIPRALPILGSIGKSSYFTFLTSNL